MKTNWYKWSDRRNIPDKDQPGVYFIAYSIRDISDKKFSLIKEIIYIGRTISKKGIHGRLSQFERAMKGSDGIHGGAERVRFKYKNPDKFFVNAYVYAYIFPIPENTELPDELRVTGNCLKHELDSMADYYQKFNLLPEFNDMHRSKKK